MKPTLGYLKGKSFDCVRTAHGINTIEDMEKIRFQALHLAASNHLKMTETDSEFLIGENYRLFKPKVHKESTGVITFRKSGDYLFEYMDGVNLRTSHGDKVLASNVLDNVMKLPLAGGDDRYFRYDIDFSKPLDKQS